MISELITFRITKAKAKVKFRVKCLRGHECQRSSVQLISIRKAKAKKYYRGIHFTFFFRVNGGPQHKIMKNQSWGINLRGPVFALARIQEHIFEELFSAYLPNSWGNSCRCEHMPHPYSHPREYRKNSWRIIHVLVSCQGVFRNDTALWASH